MAAGEKSSSVSKSAISEGSIVITKPQEQKQDISKINRNTKRDNTKVLKDKEAAKKIAERQELAALFGELAANGIHNLAEAQEWKDGSPEKIALHAAVAAVSAGIVKGDITAAAVTGGATEALSDAILEAIGETKGSSAVAQWAAAITGAALSKASGGEAQSGASIAANAIKNNLLNTDEDIIRIDKVVWYVTDDEGKIQFPHVGILVVYKDGKVTEIDFGNYNTEKMWPTGAGTIVQSDGDYMVNALRNGKAKIHETWKDKDKIRDIVSNINNIMLNSDEYTGESVKDVLRESMVQGFGDISTTYVYMNNKKFEFYNLIMNNCRSFVDVVTEEKTNNFNTFVIKPSWKI